MYQRHQLERTGPRRAACAVAGDPVPFIVQQLRHSTGPIIPATDYVRAVSESIRAYLP
jgi:pyruvate dehydrogenase complex dehydrogenase (E1) component